MKYLIMFDAGYGETYDEIEADSLDEADKIAYECWRDEAESAANYWAKEMTDQLREDYLE